MESFPEKTKELVKKVHDYARWTMPTDRTMLGHFRDIRISIKYWPRYHNGGGDYSACASLNKGCVSMSVHEFEHSEDPVDLITRVVWGLTEEINSLKVYCQGPTK